jgi:autotransporter-associated beta strand protein
LPFSIQEQTSVVNRFSLCGRTCLLAVALLLAASPSRADIYQWTMSGGSVTESGTVCPGGAGASAVPGANLASLDLTQAYLIGANLSNAAIYSATLTNADMSGANLSGSSLYGATLSGATLTGAAVIGTVLDVTDLTASQLYSTASYQAKDLQGISMQQNNLAGWNLAGQNLSTADLSSSTLNGANLAGADLSYAVLFGTSLSGATLCGANLQQAGLTLANLSGANLSAADLRGAIFFNGAGANLTNTIGTGGTIQGLSLNAGNSLTVRNCPLVIPVYVNSGMTVSAGGTLQAVFDGPTWNSTISFSSGIPVSLGGDLDLQIAAGVAPSSLLGHTFQLFNWTGVAPQGQFDEITSGSLPANYYWDTSSLYTLGTLDLAASMAGGPVNGQWLTNGGGLWSAAGNWTGGNVPKSPQNTALFGAALTSGTANVILDIPVSLASLDFSAASGASYVIKPSSSGSLALSNTAGAATIGNGGNNTIAAPIVLQSNLDVSSSANGVLTISGAISESGGSCSLTFSGPGELVLSGSNIYSGGTIVSGGSMVIANNDSLADGTDLTVGNPAAFTLPVFAAQANTAVSATPVPEPGSLALLGAGAVVLVVLRAKRPYSHALRADFGWALKSRPRSC